MRSSRTENQMRFVPKGKYASPLHDSCLLMAQIYPICHDDLAKVAKVAHSVNNDWRRKFIFE